MCNLEQFSKIQSHSIAPISHSQLFVDRPQSAVARSQQQQRLEQCCIHTIPCQQQSQTSVLKEQQEFSPGNKQLQRGNDLTKCT